MKAATIKKAKCASPDCKKEFTVNRPGKRFCSARCRIRESVRAIRDRQKASEEPVQVR